MEKRELDDLVEALAARLVERGVPQGSWLVDVLQARQALAQADDVLRRLQRALEAQITGASPPPPAG